MTYSTPFDPGTAVTETGKGFVSIAYSLLSRALGWVVQPATAARISSTSPRAPAPASVSNVRIPLPERGHSCPPPAVPGATPSRHRPSVDSTLLADRNVRAPAASRFLPLCLVSLLTFIFSFIFVSGFRANMAIMQDVFWPMGMEWQAVTRSDKYDHRRDNCYNPVTSGTTRGHASDTAGASTTKTIYDFS